MHFNTGLAASLLQAPGLGPVLCLGTSNQQLVSPYWFNSVRYHHQSIIYADALYYIEPGTESQNAMASLSEITMRAKSDYV